MQLSYNVIKNNSIKSLGAKEIVTDSQAKIIELQTAAGAENEKIPQSNMESYEKIAKSLVENARKQSEAIISKAYEEARLVEEEAIKKAEFLYNDAFEKGSSEGYEKGHQEGFSKAYNDNLPRARKEAADMIASAEALLQDAKNQYEQYLKAKEEEIKNLIFTIARTVLQKELEDTNTVKTMIYNALETSKKAKNFVIRCSSLHLEELKAETANWKESLGFIGDIFVIKDDSLEPGNAVIDKGNGKVVVGVDIALQKISDILEGKD